MPRRKLSEVERVAREQLGFSALRPGQEESVRSVIQGRDTLVIQPTGSGKSAIYQAAALMMEGPTVVISPLIALQKDQVDSITSQPHRAEAILVNSTLRTSELRESWEKAAAGKVEFIFLAPEQLRKPETVQMLREAEPSLFVIDEAHCISQWGHDFRPDYLSLGAVIQELGHPIVLALTATAAPSVRDEIVSRLRLRDPAIFVRGFDRPNIRLRVDSFQTEDQKLEALLRRVSFATRPGIVYAATRKNAETIVAALQDGGVDALCYHAGLKAADRKRIQDSFMGGDAGVVVATNAFGMGVDKSDVRFVYHFDIVDSLDSYYQEIGRAGRDGETAEAVLFYRPQNLSLRRFQAGGGKLERRHIEQIATLLAGTAAHVPVEQLAERTRLSPRKVTSILHRLDQAGALETNGKGGVRLNGKKVTDAVEAALTANGQWREARREKLEMMQRYAELSGCRREFLLRYFGDPFEGPCGNCDNDASPAGEHSGDEAGTRREVA